MTAFTVPAGRVRVPDEVREAIDRRDPVTITAHNRSAYVILHPDDYAIVSPLLEEHRCGRSIPIDRLLTADDLEILAMDDEDGLDLVAEGILESWND